MCVNPRGLELLTPLRTLRFSGLSSSTVTPKGWAWVPSHSDTPRGAESLSLTFFLELSHFHHLFFLSPSSSIFFSFLFFSLFYLSIVNLGASLVAQQQRILLQGKRHQRCRSDPWVGKIPWMRAWQPTPIFLPGEPHRQGSHRVTKSGTRLKQLSTHA